MQKKKSDDMAWRGFINALHEKNYSKISECAKEQERSLLFGYLDGNSNEKEESILQLLSMFKVDIQSKTKKETGLYELGVLEGYARVISALQFEENYNKLAMSKFENAKMNMPAVLLKNAIKTILFLNTPDLILDEKLRKEIKLTEAEFDEMVAILAYYGIIQDNYNLVGFYSLTESGERVAMQIKKNRQFSKQIEK